MNIYQGSVYSSYSNGNAVNSVEVFIDSEFTFQIWFFEDKLEEEDVVFGNAPLNVKELVVE